MILHIPTLYTEFACIGGSCPDNCCIGWELDIDEETYGYYMDVPGEFGVRLRESISDIEPTEDDDGGHTFSLKVGGRCPFLNSENLCDIVCELGPEALCEICAEYPRRTFYYGPYVTRSLTLSCPEACRLVMDPSRELAFTEKDLGGSDDLSENDMFADAVHAAADAALSCLLKKGAPLKEKVLAYLHFANEFQKRLSVPEAADASTAAGALAAAEEAAKAELCRRAGVDLGKCGAPSSSDSLSAAEAAAKAELCGGAASTSQTAPAPAGAESAEAALFVKSAADELLGILKDAEHLKPDCTDELSLMEAYINEKGDGLAAALKSFAASDSYDSAAAIKLLAYFTDRYFPCAYYDCDAAGSVGFACACTGAAILSWAAEYEKNGRLTHERRRQIISLFSREIEHSDYNIDYMMEEISFSEALKPAGLLKIAGVLLDLPQ